jgi:hypothetical protein
MRAGFNFTGGVVIITGSMVSRETPWHSAA